MVRLARPGGRQYDAPEFNQVRVDPWGLMRFGISVPSKAQNQAPVWKVVYQAETAAPQPKT